MCHILLANSVHQNIINLLQQKYQPLTKSPCAFNIPWLSCVKLNNVTSSREWAMMYMVYHFQVKASKMCHVRFCLHVNNITRNSYAQMVQQ